MTTDPIAKLKILEATRLRLQLERRLQNLRFADLAALVTSFVAEEGISLNLLKEIYQADFRQTDLLTDPVWKANFMATIRVQAMKRFSMLDNLSMLGAMNSQPKAANAMRWNHIADAVWLTQMRPGRFGVITGRPDTGKTDIATRIAQVGINSGLTVVSNIAAATDWVAVSKASSLIKALVSDTKPKLCLLDEMGVSMARKQAMSNRNISLEKLCRVIRKFRASLIVIIQERSTIPPLIDSFSTMRIHKETRTRCEVMISNKECKLDNTLTHVPKSTLVFDTNDIAPLDMDIDIDKVFSAASEGQGSPAKQRRAILEYLDKPRETKKKSDKTVRKEIAKKLIGTMSQQKIANTVGLSPATVNKVAKLSHS